MEMHGGMPGRSVNTLWIEGVGAVVEGPVKGMADAYSRFGKWDGGIDRLSQKDARMFWAIVRHNDTMGVVAR